MTFSLYVSVDDTTTQLNDGAPFRFENAEGLSGADVLRHEQRGPLQSGVTDLGFRFVPRVITLNLLFYANSDAILDGYRDTLMTAFKPLESVSIFLTVQRDDGEIRKLACHTVDEIAIALVPEERAAHMHRATVKLRAASPLWKANVATSGTASFADLGSWWLAGGAITSGSVKAHVEYPTNAQSISFLGTITGDWAVAFVTEEDNTTPGGTVNHYVFSDSGSANFRRLIDSDEFAFNSMNDGGGYLWFPPGYGYHVVESRSGTSYWRYWDGTALVENGNSPFDSDFIGVGRWRSIYLGANPDNYWGPELRKAAIIANPTLSQLNALGPYMLNDLAGSVNVVNDGDVYAYPLMTLRGPLADPVIVNQTAGGTIDLTGATLGSGDVWTIDLRDGDKRIYDQGGVNQLGSPTTLPLGIVNFALAPAPIAAGGTNVITMTHGSAGSAALFTVEIINQYMSF